MNQKTIFISLVAYCDNELIPTLTDIFAKAMHPERVRVGLINQDDYPPRFHECPGIKPWLNQIAHKHILPSLSKGYGACRAEVNRTFYHGEDFYLQIAPHSRLAQDWDVRFLELYKKIPGKKHILIATPHDYDPTTEQKSFFYYVCGIKQFHTHAIVEYQTERNINGLDFSASGKGLIEQPMFVAGCIFAPAKWLRQVPYDENIYLMGEEFDISIRTFGAGYRAMMFKDPLVWHCWGRRNRKKIGQIDDRANFTRLNNESKKYIFEKLLDEKYERQTEFFARYGLTRKDLIRVYRNFMKEIRGNIMTERYTRARALLSHRYSTGFKTRAGDVFMVPALYMDKYPGHFQVLEDKKPEVSAPSQVRNMKPEETAPLSTERADNASEAPTEGKDAETAPLSTERADNTPEAPTAGKDAETAPLSTERADNTPEAPTEGKDAENAPQADLAPQKRRRGRPRKAAKC